MQPSARILFIMFFVFMLIPGMGFAQNSNQTQYRTMDVNGLEIFYREAGPKNAPTIVLLHGFPTSSHMFRNLIPLLSDRFHLIAPDYPGFGNSSKPGIEDFDYTFDRLANVMEAFIDKLGLEQYSLYLMDYGAPVGFRIAVAHPEKVTSLIVQNGNAYKEGLKEFWDPIRKYWQNRTGENAKPLAGFISLEGVKWQYTHGVRNKDSISPDNWKSDLTTWHNRGILISSWHYSTTTKTISPFIPNGRHTFGNTSQGPSSYGDKMTSFSPQRVRIPINRI